MEQQVLQQEFTIPNGLGIRIVDRGGQRSCRVIRWQRGSWHEIGREYSLPLQPGQVERHPRAMLSVALRAHEMGNPGSSLRRELTVAQVLRAAS